MGGQRGRNAPADTCIGLEPFWLHSSEDVALEEDRHFLFMLMGTLQLSKYLPITTPQRECGCPPPQEDLLLNISPEASASHHLTTLSRQLICW